MHLLCYMSSISEIRAIDKINTVINGLEKDMLSLKASYEAAVETRNYAGIQVWQRETASNNSPSS